MNNELNTLTSSMTMVARPAWADMTGLIASIGCAIHCAAMPIVIGYLPALGLGWVATQGFHQAMALICSLIAIAAFVPGWRKHKRLLPTALGLIGITLLTSHAFGSNDCCSTSDAVCSEQACELCADTGQSPNPIETKLPTSTKAESVLWSSIAWLVTPLGGFFLICAHLVNHRLGCLCCQGEHPCGTEV